MAAAVAIQPLAPRSGPMAFNQQQPRTSKAVFLHGPVLFAKRLSLHSYQLTWSQRKTLCVFYLYHCMPSFDADQLPGDGCRRRKSKCVLQDSLPCVLCEFHKQDCTFVEAAQPRKRKVDDSAGLKDTPNAKR